MRDRQEKIYPRMNNPLACVMFGGWGAMILCMGIWGMSDGLTTWSLPFWRMEFGPGLFIAMFLLLWYGILLALVRRLILGLEWIKISQEEVRLYFGPFLIRRLYFSEIRTVVRTGGDMSECPETPLRSAGPKKKKRDIVFCTADAEELRMRSRSAKSRRKADRQQLRMRDVKKATNQEVKRYFERRMLITPFWMEWSTAAEETLMERLTTTVFIL